MDLLGIVGSQGGTLALEMVSRPTVEAESLCHMLITSSLVLYRLGC
jgi:hypothetical protein